MKLSPISTTPMTAAAVATPTTTVAAAAPSANRARYGGILHGVFPDDHWTRATDPEGDPIAVPMVIAGPAIRARFPSLQDAIDAARRVSRGERDAVAVVRAPGSGDAGPWFVDRLLVNDFYRNHAWAPVDLEGVMAPYAGDGYSDVFQPLNSQRSVIIGAIVDGDMVLDRVVRYQSSRPDLPGRDPDRPTG
jgi:hypothetical protein